MLSPNRFLSVLITLAGGAAFVVAAFELIPLQRDVYFFCLFFGLVFLAGGVTLLLIQFKGPTPVLPTPSENLLANPIYEDAFRRVVSDQSKKGKIAENSLQTGVDFLIANGISPEDAWNNLRTILKSYADEISTD